MLSVTVKECEKCKQLGLTFFCGHCSHPQNRVDLDNGTTTATTTTTTTALAPLRSIGDCINSCNLSGSVHSFVLPSGNADVSNLWEIRAVPPQGEFFGALVRYVNPPPNTDTIWIVEEKHIEYLMIPLNEMNEQTKKMKLKKVNNPKLGALVVAPYRGLPHRGKIVKVNIGTETATVNLFLIDVGVDIICEVDRLFEPTAAMLDTISFAMPLRIPNMYDVFHVDDMITVRIYGTFSDKNTYMAELKSERIPRGLPVQEILNNNRVEIKQTFRCGTKAIVKLKESVDISAKLNGILSNTIDTAYNPMEVPEVGSYVAINTDNGWCRGKLLGFYEPSYLFLAYLVDEGRMEVTRRIKILPPGCAYEPMQSFMIIRQDPTDDIIALTYGKTFEMQIEPPNRQVTRGEVITQMFCQLKANEEVVSPMIAKVFDGDIDGLDIEYWLAVPPKEISIFITKFLSNNDVMVNTIYALQYPQVCREMFSACEEYASIKDVVIGDLSVVKVEEASGPMFLRGMVIKYLTKSGFFKVFDVDTGYVVSCTPSELRKPNNFIRCLPTYLFQMSLIFVKIISGRNENFNASYLLYDWFWESNYLLLKFCAGGCCGSLSSLEGENKYQFMFGHVEHSVPEMIFESLKTLREEQEAQEEEEEEEEEEEQEEEEEHQEQEETKEQEEKVEQVEHKEQEKQEQVEHQEQQQQLSECSEILCPSGNLNNVFTVKDLTHKPLTQGDCVQVYVLASYGIYEGFLLCTDFTSEKDIEELKENMLKVNHCNRVLHRNGYRPKLSEVCLVLQRLKKLWYRAICVEILDRDLFRLLFVDYGIFVNAISDYIVPITGDLMFPTHANICYVKAIPPNLVERLKKYVSKFPLLKCSIYRADTDPLRHYELIILPTTLSTLLDINVP